jgi:hypothetical protein
MKPGIKSIARIIDPACEDEKKRDEDCIFLDIVKSDNPDELQTEVKLDGDLKLEPLFIRQGDDSLNNRIYIAGPSMTGKSFMASLFAKDYKRQFKKNKIAVFSYCDSDKNLNEENLGKRLQRIKVDEGILDDPLELSECNSRLCIFDDIGGFSDKKITDELTRFANRICNTGRHQNIDLVVTSQMLLHGHASRTLLNGCFQVIGFPHYSGKYQLHEWMKRYLYLPAKTIDKILSVPSRWILINNAVPLYVLHERGAFMLDT